MLGQRSGDLAALATYKSAKTPRPDRYFFEPKFLQKTPRPVVFTERSIQILVFDRILFPVGMLDQQAFGEKPVLQGILRNCSLSRWCSGSGGLQSISAIGFRFSGGDWWFFPYSPGCCSSLGFSICPFSLIV